MRYSFLLFLAIALVGCSDRLSLSERRVITAQEWRLQAASSATTSHFGLPIGAEREMGRDWSRYFERSLLIQFEDYIVFYDFLTDSGIRLDFDEDDIDGITPFLGDAVRENRFVSYTENASRQGAIWNTNDGVSALVKFTLNVLDFEEGDLNDSLGLPVMPALKADVMMSILLTNFHSDLMNFSPSCTAALYLEYAASVNDDLLRLFEFLDWRVEAVNEYPDGERIIYYGYYIGNPAFIVEVVSTGRDENCTILAAAHKPIVDVAEVFPPLDS